MMLLKMNISSSILIILIVILRFVAINRLPKRFFVLLWNIAILRLLLPFDLPIHYGLASPMVKIADDGFGLYHAANGPVIMKISKEPIVHIVDLPLNNVTWMTFVWIIGIAVMLVAFGALYRKEYQKIRTALPISEESDCYLRSVAMIPKHVKLLVSDSISTPLTYGILSPKIIFPKIFELSDSTKIKCVLTHEVIHIKRLDNLWKIVIFLVVSLHWFNPFVWVMYGLFNRDIELSCDEKVVALLGEATKKEYAMMLVDLAQKQCRWFFIANGFGKNAIQERIVAIMKFKKATCMSIGCTVVLLAGAVTVFAQNDFKTAGRDMNIAPEIHSVEDKKNYFGKANEIFSGFKDYDSNGQMKEQYMGEITRLTKEELPNRVIDAIKFCDDEKWFVIHDIKYQYVYFNGLPANYAFQPEIDVGSHSGTLQIYDMGTSTGNYVLLQLERDVIPKIFYNHSQVTYIEVSLS